MCDIVYLNLFLYYCSLDTTETSHLKKGMSSHKTARNSLTTSNFKYIY